MGLFDFIKKGIQQNSKNQPKAEANYYGESIERLTPDGELPFGWIYRNSEFTSKINNEYSYFLDMWIKSKSKSPTEQYSALKSFVLFLEDAEKLCVSKGECFVFWFHELLASKDYIEKRKNELVELSANFGALNAEYESKTQREEEKQRRIDEMKSNVIILLKENDGILQSDFWKLFDDEISRAAATDIVYSLLAEGKIERIKHGRSYILHYKQ